MESMPKGASDAAEPQLDDAGAASLEDNGPSAASLDGLEAPASPEETLEAATVEAADAEGLAETSAQVPQTVEDVEADAVALPVEDIEEPEPEPKKRQVLVTSNCQTGGVTLCLKALLPDTDIHMLPMWQMTPEAEAQTREAIDKADVWVTIIRDAKQLALAEGKQVVKIPYLNFPAFHPDICYVRDTQGGLARCVGDSDYHSLIVLWSYKAGLSVEQAKAMFRKDVFREIGYFDGWDSAIADQRAIFRNSEFAFDDYIRPLVSKSPFMHTPNHPNGTSIAQLSKLIARKITGDERVMKAPLDYLVQDTLSHIVTWPVYPEIAEQYGFEGCYIWKFIHGVFFTSLDHFVSATYAHYDSVDLSGWVCDRLENRNLQDKLKTLAGL